MQEASTLFKIIVTAFSAIAYWRAFTPPTPNAKLKHAPIDGIFGQLIRYMAFTSKVYIGSQVTLVTFTQNVALCLLQMLVCFSSLCQIILLWALSNPTQHHEFVHPIITTVCPNPTVTDLSKLRAQMSQFPPSLLLGYSLMISMAILRMWCFRSLQKFFTYEITIQSSHKLIQTGPYRYVRHPSYTAQILLTGGVYIMGFSRGTWIKECQITSGSGFYFVWSYILVSSFGMYKLYTRGDIEDRELHKAFGDEWIRYRKEVPYKFIPHVI